jgi:hypothetical protein
LASVTPYGPVFEQFPDRKVVTVSDGVRHVPIAC